MKDEEVDEYRFLEVKKKEENVMMRSEMKMKISVEEFFENGML